MTPSYLAASAANPDLTDDGRLCLEFDPKTLGTHDTITKNGRPWR